MKVVKWVTWSEGEKIEDEVGCDCSFDAYSAVVAELRDKKLKFGGYAHQSDDFKGVPVFDNGKVFAASMRKWGEVMADAWGGDYTDYAWKGFDCETNMKQGHGLDTAIPSHSPDVKVAIKNFTMPKDCRGCCLVDEEGMCKLSGEYDPLTCPEGSRSARCPLVYL